MTDYTVTLTATNSEGSDTESQTLTLLNASILASSAISTTVSKGINDLMWICQMEYDGHPVIDSQDITVYMKDHTDTDQLIFMGYIPSPAYKTQEAGNRTILTAYSYFWYLTKQYLPPLETDFTGLQNTMFYNATESEVTPTVDIYNLQPGETTVKPGETVYIDISKYVNEALGGVSSTTINGLTIHEVTDNDDWNDGSLLNKDFGFVRDDITIMDALQAIKEYTGYYFVEVFYNSTTDLDYAIWVPGSATDAQLHLPAMVTFTWPDEYVIGPVYGEDKSGEMYNKVRVRGSPVYLSETFTATATTDTFTLSQHGRANSCSASVQHGIGGEIDDTFTVTEHLSSGEVDWVSLTGLTITPTADLVTIFYLPAELYYEATWETAGVTAGTEKPREYPPIWDREGELGLTTQDDVDEYCNTIQYLIQTDPSIYHATLAKRTDLRLMQKVRFIGYDKIPSDEMRIIHITYRKGPQGIFVDIQCVLDRTLTLRRTMKEITMVSDVNLIERVVEKKIKDTNNEKTVAAWIVWSGNDLAIAQTDNGVYVTRPTI